MITTLFLDVYGTLISTGRGSVNAAAKILQAAGSSLDPAAFYRHWKKLHKQHMTDPFQREEDIFRQDLAALYRAYAIDRNAAEDVSPMLESLYGRPAFADALTAWPALRKKYRLIIASNTDTEPLLVNLKANGFMADAIFTSEILKCYKPSPEFYEKLLAQTGVSPREAAFVGDSLEEDALCPRRAGMLGVLLDRKSQYDPQADAEHPDAVIRSLTELEKIL